MESGEGNSRDQGARGFREHIKKAKEAIDFLSSYAGKEEDSTSGSEGMRC